MSANETHFTGVDAGTLKVAGTLVDATGLGNVDVLDVTAGTATASKAVVLDASSQIDALDIIAPSINGVAVSSTAAEIDRACDVSARLVALTATASITLAAHDGREMYITGTSLATYTLPEATGSGMKFRFVIGEVNTSNNVFVVADTTNANFIGNILTQDADLVGTIATLTQLAPANADTLTFDGTTTGGQLGDWIELVDVATDVWFVTGITSVPAGSNTATPFSAAV